jgi:hypothetical protein
MPTDNPQTEEEWLECIPLPEYLRRIPRGHILMIDGTELWLDGDFGKYTAEGWQKEFGSDPGVIWAAKKKYLAEIGPGVHVDHGNTKFKELGGK